MPALGMMTGAFLGMLRPPGPGKPVPGPVTPSEKQPEEKEKVEEDEKKKGGEEAQEGTNKEGKY